MKNKALYLSLLLAVFFLGCKKKEDTCPEDTTTTTTGGVQTFTVQPDATTGVDAVLGSCVACGYSTTNYGTAVDFVGLAWTNGSNSSNLRSLIKFDLSSIPSTSTVISAKLSLYYNPTSSNTGHSTTSGSNTCLLQTVTQSWTESTVTWNNQPTTTSTNQVVIPESTSSSQDYLDIDITALVQNAVSNPSTNYGFMIKLLYESAYRSLLFCSSDHSDASKHPKLVVKYQ